MGLDEYQKGDDASPPDDAPATATPTAEAPSPSPSTAEIPPAEHWWVRYRVAIVGALLAALFATLAAPTRDWLLGATDEVHDFFIGYEAGQVDDMRERIESRPFWQGAPDFKEGSMGLVERFLGATNPVTSLQGDGSIAPRIALADGLVADAPDWDGVPVILIGRLYSRVNLGGELFTLDREESILTGLHHFIYVGEGTGLTSTARAAYKGIVAAQGVLVANGRAQSAANPAGVETAYFIAMDGIYLDPHDPVLAPYAAKLLKADPRQIQGLEPKP